MSSGVSKNRSTLVTDCVEAALEIIDLCRLLRDETGLARASFTEFSSCRAALLVILAQSLTKRTERLREALQKGMGLIKIMSMGVGSARSAVSVIEALERAISRLEEYSASQGAGQSGSHESAYDRFKNWEMLWKTGPVSPDAHTLTNANTHTNIFQSQGQGQDGYQSGGSGVQPHLASLTPTSNLMNSQSQIHNENAAVPHHDITSPSDFLTPHAFSQMPHIGLDHFVSNLPQELGEFTAIPCFETEGQTGPGSGAGPGLPGELDMKEGWMTF